MMYLIRRVIIWIYRWRHSRGFGVQSPNDYSFIRYVINEHLPYYAYDRLRKEYDKVSALERKKGELYFRIANWLQPDVTVLMEDNEVYRAYIQAGCNKTRVENGLSEENVNLLISRLYEENVDSIIWAFDRANDSTLFMIEDIYSEGNYKLWERLKEDDKVGVTFDLYYVGILFFDKTRYKQHYKVNF